ncbi:MULTISPECIES: monovalent cation:proton antiporter-2 (CPA2) family protein [Rhodomicrobium]|uniref:monovalent cation:proton antiporter-2 (CPA2) family protein n=1 Tax=Rhodomicrobium TaxID=1068 RepID=UPI000B4A6D45|nr:MULTISPECIES: monovalent cation:proton antiporter-2 (CPA2) family protein [Rhodomicrobium]
MAQVSFLLMAFVYLAVAVISVPIAKRLGLGSVLGYLIGGVLIGPFGASLVGDQTDVMHFAEFGVVMMLFLVGLELRPQFLWQLRKPILGLGSAQLIGTTAVLAGTGIALGFDWRIALAAGIILAMSSTAIVLQTLAEKNLMKTPVGQASFSVLLFQDIAVIPLLAFLPLLAFGVPHGDAGGHGAAAHAGWIDAVPGWAYPLVVIGAVASIILAGRLALRPVFRYIASARLREMFTAFGLLIVVGIAVLMQAVGLSPALGTFLAGVVLAESEFRHELESDIEPFKGLLMGLFFISVGAGIDFALLAHSPGLIAALVFGVVAVKAGVLFILSRVFRFSLSEGILFALALSQVGEFAFVLIAFALQNAVLPADIANPLVAAVALSMLTTPLLLIAYDKRIAPRLVTPEPEREPDDIQADGTAIIAGFGRFGQVAGRLLLANGFRVTVLDHDADHVEGVRAYGFKVYFGDASRVDLLKAAGAAEAKILIIAVDEHEKMMEIAEAAKKHFPQLKLLSRAYDRVKAFELMKLDVDVVKRETFGSALEIGVEALKAMGFRAYQAERAGRLFRKHDEAAVVIPEEYWDDEEGYLRVFRQKTEALERVLQADLARPPDEGADAAWDTQTLVAEVRAAKPGARR